MGLGLLRRLNEARIRTDALFATIDPDSLHTRPISERHRIIFYVGHLEAFDWNLLHDRLAGLRPFHPAFDRLFAFGIDPVGGGLPTDQPSDWPSLEEICVYRRRVREQLDATLSDSDRNFLLLNVAIEHRLMHAETLAYMLHQLPLGKMLRPSRDRSSPAPVPADKLRMIDVPAGVVTLGRADSGAGGFGWDNEYLAHTAEVPAFSIDRYQVSNRDYLQFVLAGGYDERSFWSDDDWTWKKESHTSHPVFWRPAADGWLYRTMFDEIPLPLEWPVYVSHAEASAYARWAGKTLPAEAQWHRAAYGTTKPAERSYPWGDDPPDTQMGNFDFESWEPAPVTAFPNGRSAFGVEGLLGNGWEWTSSQFEPFPGFQPFPFYPGYSADFFDGRHYVLKGGSPHTAACMLRRSFRNWFQPHYPYVYAGFRCVVNGGEVQC